ncbi:MAG: pentapeptide repeat-containing protein [Microthrixaceae bacterium]
MAALACVATAAMLAAACSSGDTTAEPVGDPVAATSTETSADKSAVTTADTADGAPSWLFTLTSTGGTFTTGADGAHTLTLAGIDPGVTAFTDRPDRDAAVVPADRFVQEWPAMFEDSAPNAVLVEHEPSGKSDSFVVTLFDPVLDGSTLTFTAEIVDGEDHSDQIPGLTETPHSEPPASFSTVSLFIDSVSGTQSGSCSAKPAPSVNMNGCDLSNEDLSNADLRSIQLVGSNLHLTKFEHADLAGANMAQATATSALLAQTDLEGANLQGANLQAAGLYGADLSYANASGANMKGALLPSSGLYKTNLSGVDLTGADLSSAILISTNLTNANLTNAKLTNAYMSDVVWKNTTCPNGVVQSTPCSP